MNSALRFDFGKGVVLIDASLVCLGSVPNFHNENLAEFRLIFCGRNPVALRLGCVIAHKTLFSPSFRYENTTMEVPHLHDENPAEFHNRQGFMPMYTARANMLVLG